MRDRSWRRYQRELAIERVAKNHTWLQPEYFWGSEEERHAAICSAATTPHPCSNYCCGNPRKWFDGEARLTRQELKSAISFEEQLLDVLSK